MEKSIDGVTYTTTAFVPPQVSAFDRGSLDGGEFEVSSFTIWCCTRAEGCVYVMPVRCCSPRAVRSDGLPDTVPRRRFLVAKVLHLLKLSALHGALTV